MVNVKEEIVKQIEDISDESVLIKIHQLIQNISSSHKIYILSPEQKASIEQGIKDYEEGRFYTTDELFDDLIDE
ncbi:MAG: hypothetical protein EOP42_26170 [Sphingobacteriaceae bacterium]|nr:MAG: hypothetical protein EOP42_26170 [Sphingobacteriaceae bacterium]